MKVKNFSEAQKKIALAIIAGCIAVAVNSTFLLRPQIRSLAQTARRLHEAEKDLKQYKKNYARIKSLQSDVESLKARGADAERNLFSDTEIPFLLERISQEAIASGVKIMQMQPLLEAQGKDEKVIGEAAGLRLYPVGVKLTLNAGYHQLGAFISLIEENPLLMVQDLKIDAHNSELKRQNAALVLRIHVNKK